MKGEELPMEGGAHTLSGSELSKNGQVERKAHVMELLGQHPFRPPWWLANNHVQTVWANRFRRLSLPPLRLERWDTPDGDFLRLHFQDGDSGKPLLLLLHGLEGSVDSRYIKGFYYQFQEDDWTVVTMEHRSCGGEMNRQKKMYHSGATEDLAFVVARLAETRPDTRVYVAGFSLGGNMTGKWLGEQGNAVPHNLKAAVVMSAPYNLVVSAAAMDRFRHRPYIRNFLQSLIPKALEKEKQFPGCVDVDAIRACRTFQEYDTHATAAIHGFRDAHHYYSTSGCGQYLDGIRRPTMLLSAEDDPFNPGSELPYEQAKESPYLHPVFTPRGGHVGHAYHRFPGRIAYWAEEQIKRFFLAYDAML